MSHPTATVYLDESGLIKTDRFFGIGCLKLADSRLLREAGRLRQIHGCFDELHWARFDKAVTRRGGAFALATAVIDAFFETEGCSFFCIVADRENGDLASSYGTAWKAYEGLSIRALDAAVGGNELVTVLADHADTPPHVYFEADVKAGLNASRGRLAVATVNRADSRSMDGLQLADLLLGAAMFDFRQGATRGALRADSQKAKLSAQLLDRCAITSFRPAGKVVPGKVTVQMRRRRRHRGRRGGDRSARR